MTHPLPPPPPLLPFPRLGRILGVLLVLVGIASFAMPLNGGHPERAWTGALIGLFHVLALGLFGVVWTAIQHLTRAAWSVPLRRVPEAMSAWLPFAVLLTPLLTLGAHTLYPWSHAEAVAEDALLLHKSPFLQLPAFLGAVVGLLLLYALLGSLLARHSRRQDQSGDPRLTQVSVRLSAVFLLFFAPGFSVLSFYLLMSLEPHWFSTMFAVLCFTDLMQTGLALMALVTALLVARGLLRGFVDENHLHDVTKMAFAFTGFWAYIFFCQYLLIWYANIPEETVYFATRTSNGWAPWLLALPVLKFLVPFLVLLPRENKRRPAVVIPTMLWLIVAQFVELFLMVAPALGHGADKAHAYLPGWEFGIFLGFCGAFYLVANASLAKHGPLPLKDPYLRAGLGHHV